MESVTLTYFDPALVWGVIISGSNRSISVTPSEARGGSLRPLLSQFGNHKDRHFYRSFVESSRGHDALFGLGRHLVVPEFGMCAPLAVVRTTGGASESSALGNCSSLAQLTLAPESTSAQTHSYSASLSKSRSGSQIFARFKFSGNGRNLGRAHPMRRLFSTCRKIFSG